MQGNSDIYQITPIEKMKKGYQMTNEQRIDRDIFRIQKEYIFKKKTVVIMMK